MLHAGICQAKILFILHMETKRCTEMVIQWQEGRLNLFVYNKICCLL